MKPDEKNQDQQQPDSACPPCPPPGYPYPYPWPVPEEDEINLIDLFKVLWKRKMMIISIVLFASVASVVISLLLTNIYRSEATITPRIEGKSGASSALSALGGLGGLAGDMMGIGGDGSLSKFEVVLNSRILAKRIFDQKTHEFYAAFFEDSWNAEKNTWNDDVEEPPTEQDVIKIIHDAMKVDVEMEKTFVKVAFDHESPVFAKQMVADLINELSEILREEALKDAINNQKYLREQLEKISDPLLKEKILTLLSKEIEKETLARVQQPYAFQILDPPIVPDPDKENEPNRKIICILSVLVAGFLAVFLAFSIEFYQNMTNKNSNSSRE